MPDIEDKKLFWEEVAQQLYGSHCSFDRYIESLSRLDALMSRFPLESEDPAVEFIYHFEPMRIARDILEDCS